MADNRNIILNKIDKGSLLADDSKGAITSCMISCMRRKINCGTEEQRRVD